MSGIWVELTSLKEAFWDGVSSLLVPTWSESTIYSNEKVIEVLHSNVNQLTWNLGNIVSASEDFERVEDSKEEYRIQL